MIVEYVRYRLKQGDASDFEAAYARAAEALAASPHCSGYELTRSQKEPERYILRIHWDSSEGHLQGFRKSEAFSRFFAEIKPYVSEIEEMEHYERTRVRSESLCDAAGGPATFFRLAHEMHHEMANDDLLGDRFRRAAPTHVPHLGMWLTEVFGGPKLYSQTLGDIGPILRRHAGQDISETDRKRFFDCAARAVARVIEDPALREPIVAYLDWGTTVAVENSKPNHVPDAGAGVPRWSWYPRG
jgi:truncated hemoglobin YjbI/quinol monooxygenase YgiN